MASNWPQPSVGDLVSCRFPFDDPSVPGEKARPCLIVRVLQNQTTKAIWVDVTPGTGQGTSTQAGTYAPLSPTEFEEPADPQKTGSTHLEEATRFDFALISRLPYNHAYFSAASRKTPVFGSASLGLSAWLNTMKTTAASSPAPQPPPKPPQVIVKKVRPLLRTVPPSEGDTPEDETHPP